MGYFSTGGENNRAKVDPSLVIFFVVIPIFGVTSAYKNHLPNIFANTPLQLALQMPPKRDPWVEKAAKLVVALPDAVKMTPPMVAKNNLLQNWVV